MQEAFAKLSHAGEELPGLVMCPFESLASSAAQGFFLATGKAQVAFVHVDVGTANAAGSLNDSKANRTPVVLCAGRSPVTVEAVPGGRSKYINWLQDVPDQGMIVRNYIKNEQIAYRAAAIPRTMQRAFQVAESDPAGPAYVTFPREALMEETDLGGDILARRYPAVPAGSPNTEDVDRIADWILEAERPVLVVGYLGRDPQAVEALVALSDLAGIGIVEYRGRVNFPLRHPHHLGFDTTTAVATSDLVVVVEHDVPYVPLDGEPGAGTRLVHIGHDPYCQNVQTWGFPSDLGVRADSRRTLLALHEAVSARLDAQARARIRDRVDRLAREHEAWTERAWARQPAPAGETMSPSAVGQVLDEMLPPDVAVFEEAVTSANPIALQVRDVAPDGWFRNGGSYLGWALGAAAGYGLARSGRTPVALVGDGSFLFAVPSAVLWFLRTHQIPALVVVVDNAAYNSVRLAGRDGYPEGAQVRHGYVAAEFDETPRADLIAQACGVAGFAAADEAEFRTALQEALAVVASGSPALVSVRVAKSDRPI